MAEVAHEIPLDYGVEEGDYESDSDGAATVVRRRRAASDDEEEDESVGQRKAELHRKDGQDEVVSVDGEEGERMPYSDEEEEEEEDDVDDREGVPPIDEEEEEEEGDEDEDEEELEEEELDEQQKQHHDSPSRQLLRRRRRRGKVSDEEEEEDDEVLHEIEGEEQSAGRSKGGESPESVHQGGAGIGGKEVAEEEKKEAEPFVVPTAGAFYMHDDRFKDNGGARPRRSMGGRKLWEAKDEKPWVHDLFEELNIGNEGYSGEGSQRGGRGSQGRARGRGRGRGRSMGGRSSNYEENNGVRTRHGQVRRRTARTDVIEDVKEEEPARSTNHSTKSLQEEVPYVMTEKSASSQASTQPEMTATKKPAGGSYLNSASPPFFPSSSLQQKLVGRWEQADTAGQVQSKGREQYGGGSMGPASKNTSSRGSYAISKVSSGHGRASTAAVQSPVNVAHSQGDGLLPTNPSQQLPRPAQAHVGQQENADGKVQMVQPTLRAQGSNAAAQQSGKGNVPQNLAVNSVQPQSQGQNAQVQHIQGQLLTTNPRSSPRSNAGGASTNSLQSANNSRYRGNGGGRARGANIPLGGRGSYMYSGATLGGGSGIRIGEQGFPPAPALGPSTSLPDYLLDSLSRLQGRYVGGRYQDRAWRPACVALQYGTQAQAGIGVPGVGMAMPSYSYGFPNSEVTWVPVLAGGAPMGTGYGAPYISMEGAPTSMYYAQPTGQPPYRLPGRDVGIKPQGGGGLWKPPPSPELGTDEFGQRQGKPRRYSEMNFGQ